MSDETVKLLRELTEAPAFPAMSRRSVKLFGNIFRILLSLNRITSAASFAGKKVRLKRPGS